MTTMQDWLVGARPKTWAIGISATLSGVAASLKLASHIDLTNVALTFVISLALVIGVNYANDYSDGIKGLDADDRSGPMRLVGSGKADSRSVKIAAILALLIAVVAGLLLCWRTRSIVLLIIGIFCVVAAWTYTGGAKPYGYAGYGEIIVFIFFGGVGVLGTQYSLTGRIDMAGLCIAIAIGSFSSAILATNNLRDISSDAIHGKNTLAVRYGSNFTKNLLRTLLCIPYGISAVLATRNLWVVIVFLTIFSLYPKLSLLEKDMSSAELIDFLGRISRTMLLWSILIFLAYWEFHQWKYL